MRKRVIALLPGDGIGPEVVGEARRVVEAVGERCGFGVEWVSFPFGAGYWKSHGETLPDSALGELEKCEALLLGAVGDPSVKPGILERGILLRLRFHFDQYINLRPARSYPGVALPVRLPEGGRIDSVVVRENTEDFYMGLGVVSHEGRVDAPLACERGLYSLLGRIEAGLSSGDAMALQVGALTRRGIERVTRRAFELARKRGEDTVILASKANAVPQLYGFLDEETKRVADAEFPDMTLRVQNVDALCYNLVRRPANVGVILCPNLFGDIVSDLQAALIGGLGLAAGGNIGDGLSMFEPVHGSAPDIAGTGKANPLGAILCAALLLDRIGEAEGARVLNQAIETYLERASTAEKPVEMGGEALSPQVGEGVIRCL